MPILSISIREELGRIKITKIKSVKSQLPFTFTLEPWFTTFLSPRLCGALWDRVQPNREKVRFYSSQLELVNHTGNKLCKYNSHFNKLIKLL